MVFIDPRQSCGGPTLLKGTVRMKMCIKKSFVIPALVAGLSPMLAIQVAAQTQTFTVLHSFTGDGALPLDLMLSGGALYGTTSGGGSSGAGTIFKINPDGNGFTTLYNFRGGSGGSQPNGGLVLSDNTLYGTTVYGDSSDNGMVFAVSITGADFTNLHSFSAIGTVLGYPTNSDGGNLYAGLTLSGNTLYGTAGDGGSSGFGTVFAINTDGTGFRTLHNFTGIEGGYPYGGLILSGNMLYGTTDVGGTDLNGNWTVPGTVFGVNTDGAGFTTLHSFTAVSTNSLGSYYTNSGGGYPSSALILSGNTLYGTTQVGGTGAAGTVFAVNTNGTEFRVLHNFNDDDGRSPAIGLILSGKTLYGTASVGGGSGNGTVFAVNTDGTGFTNLYSFTALSAPYYQGGTNGDGAEPNAGLILAGNTLFGTTQVGGIGGNGTVFSLSFTPQLAITTARGNIILRWPTNYLGFDYSGFTLQSTTNLGSSAVWTTNSPAPVIVNGQNTVTNPISGTQQFFRLIK
jgi:uncharacterized repeat protein (TIGR03803 family)